MTDSPIQLNDNDNRLATFPINRQEFWNLYIKQRASFWVPEEITYSEDVNDYRKSAPEWKWCIKHILAIFSSFDGLVTRNLENNFISEFPILEIKYNYSYINMIENIHAEVYSQILEMVIPTYEERVEIIDSVTKWPIINKMHDFCLRYMDRDIELSKRIIGIACIEGLFFPCQFVYIYYFQSYGKMLGIGQANELIARDESMHLEMAILVYKNLLHKLTRDEVLVILTEAVNLSIEFSAKSNIGINGITPKMMSDYICLLCDNILLQLGYDAHYHTSNPFGFANLINISNKTNFFERRTTEYSKLHTTSIELLDDY